MAGCEEEARRPWQGCRKQSGCVSTGADSSLEAATPHPEAKGHGRGGSDERDDHNDAPQKRFLFFCGDSSLDNKHWQYDLDPRFGIYFGRILFSFAHKTR